LQQLIWVICFAAMMSPEFTRIDNERRRQKRTVCELCRSARVPVSTYWRLRTQGRKMQPRTKRLLMAALIRPPQKAAPKPPIAADLIRTAYRGWLVHYCLEAGLDPAAVLASDPARRATANKDWARAAEIRAMAVSSVVTELDLPAKRVAEAIGVTRQAASEMLKRVEDLREDDDGRLTARGALIERAGALISGRAA
jgi:hypothetical protein